MANNGDHGLFLKQFHFVLRIAEEIRPTSVLNIGSGTKFVLEQELICRSPEVTLTSVDIASTASTISPRHTYVQCNLNNQVPNLNHREFDLIVCTETLEHLSTDTFFWQTITKYSNSNTTIVISIPNLASILCRLELLFGLQPHVLEASSLNPIAGMGIGGRVNYRNADRVQGIGHIRGLTHRSFLDMCETAGFTVKDQRGFFNGIRFWPQQFFQPFAGNVVYRITYSR